MRREHYMSGEYFLFGNAKFIWSIIINLVYFDWNNGARIDVDSSNKHLVLFKAAQFPSASWRAGESAIRLYKPFLANKSFTLGIQNKLICTEKNL